MVTDGKAKEIGGKGHSHARIVQLEFKAAENKKTKVISSLPPSQQLPIGFSTCKELGNPLYI